MSFEQIRNWLGIFYLGLTAALGAYIIIFQETVILPIASKDATSAFQIVIPTLIGQLTVIFRWMATPAERRDVQVNLPHWAVIGPPIAVISIILLTVATLIVDGGRSLAGGAIFKNAVTFCISILNASTVFLVARVFMETGRKQR